MSSTNTLYGRRSNIKSGSLSKEALSRRNSRKYLEKPDESPPLYFPPSYPVPSDSSSCSYKHPCVENKKTSPAAWVKTFLHRSARYAEFLASQDEKKKSSNHNPVASPAATASAERYARIKRTSSGPLTWRRACCTPVPSIEWVLNELLLADKLLHEKYGPGPVVALVEKKDSPRSRYIDVASGGVSIYENASLRVEAARRMERVVTTQHTHPAPPPSHVLDMETSNGQEEDTGEVRHEHGGKKARNSVEEKVESQLRVRTFPQTRNREVRMPRGGSHDEEEGSGGGGGAGKRDMSYPSKAVSYGCFRTVAGRYLATEV